jgi:signal peptidase I
LASVTPKPRRPWLETLETLIAALLLALLLRTFVVEPFIVNGYSMQPTFQNGERLLINKFWFHFAGLHDGEIVVFHPPLATSADFVKRVIATPGQTVSMQDGYVYIDGKRQSEPYLVKDGVSYRDTWTMPPEKIPPGEIFVLGDHRARSEDSRYFGLVPIRSVVGVAFFVLWPPKDMGFIHP